MKAGTTISNSLTDFRSYSVLLCFAVAFAWISMRIEPGVFARFLGTIQPTLLLLLAGVAGYVGLQYTSKNIGIKLLNTLTGKKLWYPLFSSLVLGMVIIVTDLVSPLPRDINVAFPASLFFYPAIGLIVELLFHVLPVALICALFSVFSILPGAKYRLATALVITAFLEPLFQLNMMHEPGGLTVIIGLHILLINMVQMWTFKRFGFYSMYLLRIGYYMIWHIGWGWLRLYLLF